MSPSSVRRSRWGRSRFADKRLAADLSQAELAELADVPLSTIRRLDRGTLDNPTIRPLMRCARALNCTVDDLLEDHWYGAPTP